MRIHRHPDRGVWHWLLVIAGLTVGCRADVADVSDGRSETAGATVSDRGGDAPAAATQSAPKPQSIGSDRPTDSARQPSGETASAPAAPRFSVLASDRLPKFITDCGVDDRALMTQSTTGGGGWLDYDLDGWPDLFLVQGGNPTAAASDSQPMDCLARQRGAQGFVEVTGLAGITEHAFGQGLAVGDYDSDGFPDLLVTNYGSLVLWRNCGDGTFEDVTELAGTNSPKWNSSAAWGDLNGDGFIDLYLATYVEFDVSSPPPCRTASGEPAVCHPDSMTPVDDLCFINNADGTFRSVAREWGMVGPGSKSLGVVIADLVGDARPEVYVANDVCANFLWVQQQPGQWVDQAVELGCALSARGSYQASMGVATGDYDRDGALDLYVTHFSNDYNTLYANWGEVGFQDVTESVGLVKPTHSLLGFGTWMADFNHDGAMDIFVANGHIDDWSSKGQPFQMPAQLFSYRGPDFVEQSLQAGDYFQERHLGRAVSAADFDHDGDVDLLVVNQREQPVVLQNEAIAGHHLRLRLIGRRSNRDAIGARVSVTAGDTRLVQQRIGGGSYLAAHEPQLTFGLGAETGPCRVEILWPSGEQTIVPDLAVDREWVLVEPLATQSALVIAAE